MKKRTGLLLAVAQYTIQIDNQFLSSYRPQASSWWVSTWDNRTDQTGAETGGRRWEMVGRSEFNNDAIQTVTKSFSVRLTTTSSLYNYHGHGGIKLFLKLHYKWSSHHGSNSSQLPSITDLTTICWMCYNCMKRLWNPLINSIFPHYLCQTFCLCWSSEFLQTEKRVISNFIPPLIPDWDVIYSLCRQLKWLEWSSLAAVLTGVSSLLQLSLLELTTASPLIFTQLNPE